MIQINLHPSEGGNIDLSRHENGAFVFAAPAIRFRELLIKVLSQCSENDNDLMIEIIEALDLDAKTDKRTLEVTKDKPKGEQS